MSIEKDGNNVEEPAKSKSKINKHEESRDSSEAKEEERALLSLTYTCVVCLYKSIVAMADDGNLYVYEKGNITSKIEGHNSAITCYDVNKKLELMLTGSESNRIIVWKYMLSTNTDHLLINKMKTISIESTGGEFSQIQSVCINNTGFVCGIRDGSIYKGILAEKENGIVEVVPDQGGDIKVEKIYSSQNEEVPICMDIDHNKNLLYLLSKDGKFTVWDMNTYTIAYIKDYKFPGKFLYSFKTSNKILLTFEDEFLIIDTTSQKYEEVPKSHIKCSKITAVNITSDEKFMAVASSSLKTPQIYLYYIAGTLDSLYIYSNFRSTINVIDFSTNNYYMYCEEEAGKISIFEIGSKSQNKEIDVEKLEFEMEWNGMGICMDKNLRGALLNYKKHGYNKIIKVAQKDLILISDKEGTVTL